MHQVNVTRLNRGHEAPAEGRVCNQTTPAPCGCKLALENRNLLRYLVVTASALYKPRLYDKIWLSQHPLLTNLNPTKIFGCTIKINASSKAACGA